MLQPEMGLQERFEEFLKSYMNDQEDTPYWTRIQQMSIHDDTSIYVDFRDLISFDNVFLALSKEDARPFLQMAHDALRSLLRTNDPDYMAGLNEDLVKVRFINYPIEIAPGKIKSKHIGTMVQLSGHIGNASETTPLLVYAMFRCRRCGEEIPVLQDGGKYIKPNLCPVCGKRTPVKLVTEKSKFYDFQKLSLVDKWQDVDEKSIPGSIDIELTMDIAGIAHSGQEAKIVGIVDGVRTG